ncbi:MAG: hypothetical protein KF819_33955 [Labilithrix sp.]|nr:hypothetical protein [Labilithrix sp.]
MAAFPPIVPDDEELALPRRHAAPDSVAWVLLFTEGALLGLSALFWLSRGHFFDGRIYEAIGGSSWMSVDAVFPGVARLVSLAVRLFGLGVLCFGMLVIAISVTSYRRAERWAWYAMWVVPLYSVVTLAVVGAYHALSVTSVAWHTALLCLALLALVVPYDRFFPSEAPQRAEGAGA